MNNQDILKFAEENQAKAHKVINDLKIIELWQEAGAEINLIGSMATGLLMKHRDIDFHIYTKHLDVAESFAVMAKLAQNPAVKKVEYQNLLDEQDQCLEWHAWCSDDEGQLWQIDMMHIIRGSTYDGYFEKVAQRIKDVLTPQLKETILRLKYDTPEDVKIRGIEYYQAAIAFGVKNYDEFDAWRKAQPENAIIEWMP